MLTKYFMIKNFIHRLYSWYGAKTVWAIFAILVIIVIVGLTRSGDDAEKIPTEVLPLVEMTTAASLETEDTLQLIGIARSTSQAQLVAETTGRVVRVPVRLGETVSAGTVIAELENAAERAALLQAQGIYEAAQANSAQGEVTLNEADINLSRVKNTAISTHATAYNTVNGIVRTNLDQFFSNPDGQIVGLRIGGRGYTMELNTARRQLQQSLPNWQNSASTLSQEDDLTTALTQAESYTRDVLKMTETFIAIFSDSNQNETEAETRRQIQELTTARATLLSTLDRLQGAKTELRNAAEAVRRSGIVAGGQSAQASLAEAQLKQALGTLRAAENNFNKTIIRSPISGQIDQLNIRAGDFVSQSTLVASVINPAALELVTYVNRQHVEKLNIGDSVRVEENATGTISSISPSVDQDSGKIEVRVMVTDAPIKAGDRVRLNFALPRANETADTIIRLPLAAVKFEGLDSYVLGVENNRLTRIDVVTGAIIGNTITISQGLDLDTPFVVDARGKNPGTEVEVINP